MAAGVNIHQEDDIYGCEAHSPWHHFIHNLVDASYFTKKRLLEWVKYHEFQDRIDFANTPLSVLLNDQGWMTRSNTSIALTTGAIEYLRLLQKFLNHKAFLKNSDELSIIYEYSHFCTITKHEFHAWETYYNNPQMVHKNDNPYNSLPQSSTKYSTVKQVNYCESTQTISSITGIRPDIIQFPILKNETLSFQKTHV